MCVSMTVGFVTMSESASSSSTHCKTGRVAEAERSTHLKSSNSTAAVEGVRPSASSDANIDSSSTRTTVVTCGLMRMCCSIVGKNPASVTRTVYMPGRILSLRKTPCVLVRKSIAGLMAVDSEAGAFPDGRLELLRGSNRNADRQTRPGEKKRAQDSESCLLHFALSP